VPADPPGRRPRSHFSVNLKDNVFHCFDARCSKQGDVDRPVGGAAQLRAAGSAIDLVNTFGLEPAPG